MSHNPKRRESGQILILLTLVLVGLLGFTALAVDGSMIFSDRRYDQSAADDAALAGAQAAALSLRNSYTQNSNTGDTINFTCDPGNSAFAWVQAAMNAVFPAVQQRAATNHFILATSDVYPTLAALENARYGVFSECVNTAADQSIYVHVMLTNTVSTSLLHFVYGGPVRNTVTAVSQATPAAPFAYGSSIIALRTDCPNNSTGGVQFQGNETVTVDGGGVFSNFCLFKNGSSTVNVTGGSIQYNDQSTYQHPGNPDCGTAGANISPCPNPTSSQMFFNDVQAPNCSLLPDNTWSGNNLPGSGHNKVLAPGRYYKDPSISGNNNLSLSPGGLYCFYDGFTITGSNPTLTGTGVTIAMMGGGMSIAGGVTVHLSAPGPAAEPPAIPGMLIYQPPSNTSDLQIGGNASSTMTGTIFAPTSQISFSGTSSLGSENYGVQIIGDTVIINGTPNLGIVYNKDNTFFNWPSVGLAR